MKTKKFEYRGILLNLDGVPDNAGDAFTKDSKILIDKKLKVFRDFRDGSDCAGKYFMGSATAYKRNGAIKYKINLLPQYEEIAHLFTPAMGGVLMDRDGKFIKKVRITQIGLTTNGNADRRIKRLGK